MAGQRGLNADFRLDNSGGALTDISRSVNNVDFSRQIEELDCTTFQAPGGDREYIVGFKNNQFSIAGNADATIATLLNGIAGQEATVSFQYGPEGAAAGKRRYTGECVLTSYSESTTATGLNTFQAQLRITGAVAIGVYP
jgi:hypothetical protein